MPWSAYHIGLDIELNATLDDLGHPDLPLLWQEMTSLRPFPPGLLQCMDSDCPAPSDSLYPKTDSHGQRIFSHFGESEERALATKSEEHKAWQERLAVVAEREGLAVAVERRADGGRRIKDVHIVGEVPLAVEVQLSRIHPGTIARRVKLDAAGGDVPLWIANDPRSPVIDRAPWSRVAKATPARILAGTADLLLGGVSAAVYEDCGRRHPRCPETGRMRSCGSKHVYLEPARGVHLEQLVLGAAAGAYRPARRGKHHIWLSRDDHERFHDDRSGSAAPDDSEPDAETVREPREIDYTCHYGEKSNFRSAPSRPRDSGESLYAGTPAAPPQVRSMSTGACVGCGALVSIADRSGAPRCWRCKPGVCDAGVVPCGAPGRHYPCGWRCDAHRPGATA